ncbi:hypothetical protein ACGFK1_20650 [Mycobacterium sp. NPDC048908]|uniref:hypothetical protein n=1 Tax=Mycobacterium sp. NPDC048908 TaxID=3364292 RepID=UPI003713F27A
MRGVKKAERIVPKTNDNLLIQVLFDPIANPTMHEKLMAELEALHALESEGGGAVYVTYRCDRFDPRGVEDTDGAALLKWPGDRRIFICRSNADRLAAWMEHQDPDAHCCVCIAEDCQAKTFYDHSSRPLPISCGRVVLMFEICMACEFAVTDTAYFNIRASVLDKQADLPPGAVIDPGSPIPPQP